MEWLQALLDNSSTPVLTAFLLGLLTAISPCPLATNIAAIGYIGKDIEDRRRVFLSGLLYTAGRIVAYTVLGLVLILVIRQGASMFGIQKFISTWGEMLLGPALIVIGLLMLFSHRLNLPQFGFNGSNAEGLKKRGGWEHSSWVYCLQWPSVLRAACSISECSSPCQRQPRWATCCQRSFPLPPPCPCLLSLGCWLSVCRR